MIRFSELQISAISTHRLHMRNQNGAYLVELSLFLPFFLLIIFSVIAISTISNANSSLRHAVYTSRFAFTRGQVDLVGNSIIDEVNEWHVSGSFPPPLHSRMRGLLVSSNLDSEYSFDLYNSWAQETFHTDMIKLPPYYTYALIYAVQSMQQSVGTGIRFPCNPSADDGQGCLACRLLHPQTKDVVSPPIGEPEIGDDEYNYDFVGISCRYQAQSIVLRTVSALMSVVSGGSWDTKLILEQKRFFATSTGEGA